MHQCGGSEVRIILAASATCGLLNQSHTGFKELLVSFDSEVRKTTVLHKHANFGIGTLAVNRFALAKPDDFAPSRFGTWHVARVVHLHVPMCAS